MADEPKAPSLWSLIVDAKEMFAIVVALIVFVGWVYTVKAEVDDDHQQLVTILNHNGYNRLVVVEGKLNDLSGIVTKVQSLQDTIENAHDANLSQFQATQTQISSLSSGMHEMSSAMAAIQQGQATSTAQLQFLISQTTLDGKHGR